MNRQRKKPKNAGRRVATVAHGGRVGMGDAASRALQNAGGRIGNQALNQHVQDPNTLRDELLQTIGARLEGMRTAQLTEDMHHRDSRNLFRRAIYKGETEQADPGRFRDVARRYQEAAQALCNGQLSKGAQLLEQAFMLEQEVFDSMPSYVQKDLPEGAQGGGELPEGLAQVASGATCSRCSLPQSLVLADWIQALDPHIELRGVKGKNPHNWWDEEQDEDDEDGDE